MRMKKINFKEKLQKFSDQWSPKVIAEMNDYQFKLVKIQNDFIWHKHEDTDEVFIVLDGKIFIEFEDKTIEINQGEMIVVPKYKPLQVLRNIGELFRSHLQRINSFLLVSQKVYVSANLVFW